MDVGQVRPRRRGRSATSLVRLASRVRTVEVGRAGTLMDMLRQRTDGIGLGRGDPDLPTPDHIVAAGQDALARGLTRYTPLPGLPELRQAVADKLRRDKGIEADPDEAAQGGHGRLPRVTGPGDDLAEPAHRLRLHGVIWVMAHGKASLTGVRERRRRQRRAGIRQTISKRICAAR